MEMIHPGGYFPAGRPTPAAAAVAAIHAAGGSGVEGWFPDGADALPPHVAAALALAAGARARMAWSEAAEYLDGVSMLAPQISSTALKAAVANEVACIALLRGDACEPADTEDVLADGAPPVEHGRTLLNAGVAAGLAGDAGAALDRFTEAERILADAGDEHGLVLAGANRAWALVQAQELAAAWRSAADALKRARRAKDEHGTAVGLMATALVDLARGSANGARQRFGEAQRGFSRTGDVLRQVQCCHALGEIAYDGNDAIRAGALYRDGLALARPAGAQDAIERLTLLFEHR
ncbi:MAG: hypothetical protein JWM27_367 [Gemmatimonadetes bacterium]|nr:hypothetical protein [Gemmatimonadota bacterium]